MKLVQALVLYILFMFAMAIVGLPIFIIGAYKPHWLSAGRVQLQKVSSFLNELKARSV